MRKQQWTFADPMVDGVAILSYNLLVKCGKMDASLVKCAHFDLLTIGLSLNDTPA